MKRQQGKQNNMYISSRSPEKLIGLSQNSQSKQIIEKVFPYEIVYKLEFYLNWTSTCNLLCSSSENINFVTDQNTKLTREIVHSWWTYSLLAWPVDWVYEKNRVFKANITYISLTKCTMGSEMIQDSIKQNNFSSVPKSEKRKSWLLTTLQHFSEGLQRYLGSWCKSLFTQYSADSNLQKTPVDSIYVRHLVWPEQFPRAFCVLKK